jgi:hypothetical protein
MDRELTAPELYAQRAAERNASTENLLRRERRVSIARLLFIAGFIALLFIHPFLSLLPLGAFIALVVIHERIVRQRKRSERAAAFYRRGLARIEGGWQGGGDGGTDLDEEHHPYAADFDLFGRGSLFELISLAVTRSGRSTLAAWLKRPADTGEEIQARQAAVEELRTNVALREDLAIIGSEVVQEIESANLAEWSQRPPMALTRLTRALSTALPLATILLTALTLPRLVASLIGWTHPEAALRLGWVANVPAWPLVVSILATAWFARRLDPAVAPVVSGVERAEPALALLAGVIARIERETFHTERLRSLASRLRASDERASAEIARLQRLVGLLDARRNQFFAPIAVLLLWTAHVAFAIERWRTRSGAHIADWIEAVGELEALTSLASFAWEHPDFTRPEIVPGGTLFEADALGHPLIAADRRVTNSIRLDATQRLLVISGSNMSGKSTMMRSVGIGAVLAMAGSVVCARSMRLSRAQVGASIRIHDSLQENASRFYAEILRIRQVLELASQGPLLFLLDEVLAGTNSHDRRIGAEAIVRSLLEREAIGLVSTHDLALAQIAESLAPRASNVHFEDHIEDGRVLFDYTMRPGVVTKSNALALMRSVGIEV